MSGQIASYLTLAKTLGVALRENNSKLVMQEKVNGRHKLWERR